ncbi:MAG TPA: DUF2795 domain-containing protein [Candidatus Limnocylindria bacterium]|jgi:hypothetical protein|nr:DUF2795 domain-containing protein [Candidatus Limnocylindria bacterium]
MEATEVADQLLESVDYPISRADLLARAREAKVGAMVEEALARLPDREYRDEEDVTKALNAAT